MATIRRAKVPARDLLVAVEATTDPETHPVTTTGDVVRHAFRTEDAPPIQGGLVSDALLDLARQGYVGHEVIGGRDVWFATRTEEYDEATAPREVGGSDHE